MKALAKVIMTTGDDLSNLPSKGPLEVSSLRKLKAESLPFYLSKDNESENRFFAFFLINYFDDVFYNLVGDFPYDNVHGGEEAYLIRLRFFKIAGEYLTSIGEALSRNDFSAIHDHFTALVVLYLNKIDEINRVLEP